MNAYLLQNVNNYSPKNVYSTGLWWQVLQLKLLLGFKKTFDWKKKILKFAPNNQIQGSFLKRVVQVQNIR